jgi:hypothetical protein
MKKRILFAAVMAAISAPAVAGTGVDVHVSTLGYGLDVAFPVTDTVVARVGMNQFKKSINTSSGGLDYTGDFKLSSFGLLADWHLFNGVTHLTAGLMANGNKLNLAATATGGSYTINGKSYTAADIGTMTTKVEFSKTVPYLGFGWGGQVKNSGFYFNSDLGILFQGSPKATITSTSATPQASAAISDAQTQLNEDLKNYKYYPVISFGIGYAF